MGKPRIHPKTYACTECKKEATFLVGKSNLYCSHLCQNKAQRRIRVDQWLNEGKDWKFAIPGWIKNRTGYLAERDGYICSVCKIEEHNGKELVLECDHIDGDHTNNQPSNLRLICPNCHSQTDTYKGANRGNGRKYR